MSSGSSAFAAGLLGIVLAHSAVAGGASVPEETPMAPESMAVRDWSGLYFGFALATPRGDNSWRQASDGLELVPGPWDGEAMMLSLGRDWQSDRLTYGAQVSVGNGDFSASPTNAAFISCSACASRLSDLITLRGRLGLATGQFLVFATGGVARANFTATNVFGLQSVREATMTGWTAGLGVERMIGDNLSLSVSYDYLDFGKLDLPVYLPTAQTDVTLGLVQVGLNVHW